jgi:uncharacterized protein
MSDSLPILDCDNCGACCMEQGSPPGYTLLLAGMPVWDKDDTERFEALPAEALEILRQYKSDLLANRVTCDGPCVWLDRETKRCRFYEHRPQICRDFERGSEACRTWREEYEVANG